MEVDDHPAKKTLRDTQVERCEEHPFLSRYLPSINYRHWGAPPFGGQWGNSPTGTPDWAGVQRPAVTLVNNVSCCSVQRQHEDQSSTRPVDCASLGTSIGCAQVPPHSASVSASPGLYCRVCAPALYRRVSTRPAALGTRCCLFVFLFRQRCPQPLPLRRPRPRHRLRRPDRKIRRHHRHHRRVSTREQIIWYRSLLVPSTGVTTSLPGRISRSPVARGSQGAPLPSRTLPTHFPPATGPPRLFTDHRTRHFPPIPSSSRRRAFHRSGSRLTLPADTAQSRSKIPSMIARCQPLLRTSRESESPSPSPSYRATRAIRGQLARAV